MRLNTGASLYYFGLLTVLLSCPVRAVETPASQALLERANYWSHAGRSDLATQAWQQLLQLDPHHPQALAALGNSGVAPAAVPAVLSPLPTVAVSNPAVTLARPVEPSVPVVVTSAPAPTAAERAQYWEAHGRSDLAQQLRATLPAAAPAVPALTPTAVAPAPVMATVVAQPPAPDTVRTALEQSLHNSPNSLRMSLELADVYRSAGELGRARSQINRVLSGQPDVPEALFASAQLYAQQGLWLEVLQTLERVSPAGRTAEMGQLQKTAWAHVQLDRADTLARQGHELEAQLLLRQVAVELAVQHASQPLAEPPPLWNSGAPHTAKKKTHPAKGA